MSDNVVGIIGATVGIGQYIVNDYVITIAETQGEYGYTMTITKGTDVQTITLYGLTPEQYDSMVGYLEQAQAASTAAQTAQDGAEEARDAAQAALNQAMTYASNAATSASNAAQSAQDASDYDYQAAQARYAAVAAKEAAVAAQGAAESAQTAAETAASNAAASAAAAKQDYSELSADVADLQHALHGAQIVDDYNGLLASTSDLVLVLHDNSRLGSGKQCIFSTLGNATGSNYSGYTRTNGTKVYPVVNQGVMQKQDVPYLKIRSIISSWIGRDNIVEADTSSSDLTTLFGPNCAADSEGKYHMYCSDFVSAILMGITYDNSRYVLGASAENIPSEQFRMRLPQSIDPRLSKGGLNVVEMAEWMAQNGRLFGPYTVDQYEQMLDDIQIGDVFFRQRTDAMSYYGITHCVYVIAVDRRRKRIVGVQCSSALSPFEGTAVGLLEITDGYIMSLGDRVFFGRPDYSQYTDHADTPFIPTGSGTYKYNCIYFPALEIARNNSDFSAAKAGEICYFQRAMSTVEYYPVIPGSTIRYTGLTSYDSRNYLCRLMEYDKDYKFIKYTTLLSSSGTLSSATLQAQTKYVRIGMNIASGYITYNQFDNFEVTITPPSA